MLEGKTFLLIFCQLSQLQHWIFWAVMSHYCVCLHARECTFVFMNVCLCMWRSEVDIGCPSQSPPMLFVDIKSSLIGTWAHSFAHRTGQQPPGLLLCILQYYWEYRQTQICLYFFNKSFGDHIQVLMLAWQALEWLNFLLSS